MHAKIADRSSNVDLFVPFIHLDRDGGGGGVTGNVFEVFPLSKISSFFRNFQMFISV